MEYCYAQVKRRFVRKSSKGKKERFLHLKVWNCVTNQFINLRVDEKQFHRCCPWCPVKLRMADNGTTKILGYYNKIPYKLQKQR